MRDDGWKTRLTEGRSTRAVLGTLQALAAGDLSVRASGDGEVSLAINAIAARQEALARTVSSAVGVLGERRVQLDSVGESVSDLSERTALAAAALTDAVAAISQHMQVVAGATEEMAATIREVAERTDAAAANTQRGMDQARSAREALDGLAVVAAKAADVTALIGMIAARTKLLSLNARIEAASAGTAGRGFSVVANEVKELASEAGMQSTTVATSMTSIAAATTVVADNVLAITDVMSDVAAGQESIAAAVEEQEKATSEIARFAAATAGDAEAIVGLIRDISGATRELSYGGSRTRDTANLIARMIDGMTPLLDGLNVSALPVPAADSSVADSGDVVVIAHSKMNDGDHGWTYTGLWEHSTGTRENPVGDAYCSVAGSVASCEFSGQHVTLRCARDRHHGVFAVSVDGGTETRVNLYAPAREDGAVAWESDVLPDGPHTLRVRVAGEKDSQSRFEWVSIVSADVSA